MKTKNIYIFDEYISSQKNGIGTYLRELLYCLNSPEYNISLIVFNADAEVFNIVEEKGLKMLLFPVLKFHISVIDKFLRLYVKDDPDNIFFVNHSPCGELLISLKNCFPLSKIIFTIHDFRWTLPLMGNIENYKKIIKNEKNTQEKKGVDHIVDRYKEEIKMYESADGVICLSKDTYIILQCIYKIEKNKLYYIPNGIWNIIMSRLNNVDKVKNKAMLHLQNDDKILLLIGRPTRQKGVFDLIAAMNRVLESYPSTKLVIIGDGNEVSMKEIIYSTSENAAAVILTGQLSKNEVRKWLVIADIGIIPSYYEQCSYTGIEMMMYGIPIIASDGIGIRNMFQNGVNARIARIGNRKRPKEYQYNLATAIVELLGSPDTCDNLSKGARQAYEEKYHIRHMKQKYNELIQSL